MLTLKKYLLLPLVLTLAFSVSCSSKKRVLHESPGVDAEISHCLELSTKKKYEEAIDCLEAFKSRYPSDTKAAEADLIIGDSYFRKKDYLLAAETYQQFLRQYPGHPKADYAYYRSGLSYIKASPKSISRDQQNLDYAVQNLQTLVQYFPSSAYFDLGKEKLKETRTKQAEKNYQIGMFYYKQKEYGSSVPRFVTIVTQYPDLGYDEKSFYYLIDALVKINQLDEARKALGYFEQRYPSSHLYKSASKKVNK